MDSSSGDLKSITADMHNHTLTDADGNINETEGPIIEYSWENIERIVNNSGVHQVEYGHYDKYIEDIWEVARCSMYFVSVII